MHIYSDCVRFFRGWFVVGFLRQNHHRNFYHDALTATQASIRLSFSRTARNNIISPGRQNGLK